MLQRFTIRHASLVTLLLCASSSYALAQAPTWVSSWSGNLCSPRGIAILPGGDIFVGGDCSNAHIERFTSAGNPVTSWSLPGTPASGHWPPNGVAVDPGGSVYVTDYQANKVQKFSSAGALISTLEWAAGPVDVAVDAAGTVYTTWLLSPMVTQFTDPGALPTTYGSPGTGVGQLSGPIGIAVDGMGHVYVADQARQRVLRFATSGAFEMEFDPGVPPTDLAVGPDGNLYVLSFYKSYVSKFSAAGTLLLTFQPPSALSGAWRIAISGTGGIFVTEQLNHRVTKFQIPMVTSATRVTFGRLHELYR
jgi:DNA-binding beta-propeller fold protein YncE